MKSLPSNSKNNRGQRNGSSQKNSLAESRVGGNTLERPKSTQGVIKSRLRSLSSLLLLGGVYLICSIVKSKVYSFIYLFYNYVYSK